MFIFNKILYIIFKAMLKFFCESLETLKEVKQPTKDEVIKMTIAVVVIVAIAAIVLSIADWFFLNLYDGVIYNFFINLFAK